MIVLLVVGLVVGLVAGVMLGVAVTASRAERRVRAERAAAAAAGAAQAEGQAALRSELARTEALLERERELAVQREEVWEEARRRSAGEFAELSRRALQENTEQFLRVADTRLREAQATAAGELDQRRSAFDQLLAPLRDQLQRYEDGIRDLERQRNSAYAGLTERVRQLHETQEKLQAETRNLVTALRAPATRGRWGELQLRRVVEMAGMIDHCDFEEQVTTQGDEGRIRPDLVVTLPGAKQVVVDAKVPLQAFLDANDATDETSRRAHLVTHARQVRAHVDALARKGYWQQFEDAPDFVVAFIPGEPLLSTAVESDPALLEYAFANHVVLATPTTLITLLRTVAYGWQQEALAENAREVQSMARELYKRLATFGEHLAKTGRSLSGAVESYNKAVGSLERTVLPQARRFQELGVVGGADKSLPELDQLEATTRQVQIPELDVGDAEVFHLPGLDDRRALPEAGEG